MESVPHFIPIVVLCTLHLIAGLAIGFLLSAGVQRESSEVSRLEDVVQFYRTGFDRIALHAKRLDSIVETQRLLIPDPMVTAIRNFSKTTRDLQEHARTGKPPAPRPAAGRLNEKHAMSTEEIRSVLSNTESDLGTEETEVERHTYHMSQWMGRCIGNRLPTPEEFEQVMCHDLSVNGVSFYAEDVQIGQNVVIAIGTDSRTFLEAEVMNRRVVTQDDELTYLIGCRFRRRLDRETDGEIVAEYMRLPAQAIMAAAC